MLFPEYSDGTDRPILSRMEKFYRDAVSINQSYWLEADTDSRYEAGDQTLWNDHWNSFSNNKHFNFNRIRRVVEMISGHQRKNRKSTIIIPQGNADELTSDQFTKICMWIAQQENVLETISEAFHGSLITGMNLLQVWVDYRSDPISGNIKVDNCPYNSFLIDPYFRKPDLSDCNGLWKRTYLTKSECISLLPDKKDIIMKLAPYESNRDGGHLDGKFQYLPENLNAGMRNLLTYDEFYYRDYRKQRMLIDSESGEVMEWQSENEDSLNQFLSLYPQVTVTDQEIPTVRLAIVVQGKVMYDGPNPCGIDMYPFVPVFAYYSPQMSDYSWRIQGIVRGLRDPQYLYNRRKAIELDMLESQVNTGWIYKEDALVNPKDVYQSGQGRGIALKRDAQMTDVQQIPPPQVPPTTIELSRILGEEINQISGVSEELLGAATDEKAGILSMLRQTAALTTLQGLFDHLDVSQNLLGRIFLSIIQNNFTPGKVKRIIEEEPTPQFYNKNFGKYDAAVEDGFNTTTQRQMQFAQLLHLKEVGVPVPDEVLIKASTLQDKKELTEAINKVTQQQQQTQQAAAEAQIQEAKARSDLAQARAQADRGLAVERTSRVAENESLAIERQAEAQKDRMAGVLDMVRALKEIETIDINQLQTLINLANILKSQELGAKTEVEQKTVQAAQTAQTAAAPIQQATPGQATPGQGMSERS